MTGLIWADYVVLGLVGLSVLVSLWRGFLTEAVSLITWAAAFVAAYLLMDEVAGLLADYVPVPSVRVVLAFGGIFVATLFAGGLVNILLNLMLRKTGLTTTDRFLGLFFGLFRGAAIVVALVMLAGLTPLPQDPWWQESILLGHAEHLAHWFTERLPPEYADLFRYSGPVEILPPALAVEPPPGAGVAPAESGPASPPVQ